MNRCTGSFTYVSGATCVHCRLGRRWNKLLEHCAEPKVRNDIYLQSQALCRALLCTFHMFATHRRRAGPWPP